MALISPKHNFIFVKTLKTGGTSFEVELARQLEPQAVVTPVIPPIEGHEARNWERGWLRKPYYNHMTAARIREFIGADAFGRMFKFCVEREPVAKCISFFHMLKNSDRHGTPAEKAMTWAQYVDRGQFPVDFDKYAERVDGRPVLLVDEVIPYERMNEAFSALLPRLGLQPVSLDTRAKGDYSAVRHVRKEDVTPAQRAAIYAAFAESLAVAGLESVYRP